LFFSLIAKKSVFVSRSLFPVSLPFSPEQGIPGNLAFTIYDLWPSFACFWVVWD